MRIMTSLATLLLLAACVSARVIYVPGGYPTIQAGINAASPGDTVQVAPGIYYENVHLTEGVSLFGSGRDVTTVDGGGSADVITAYLVNNVVIADLSARNSQQSGSAPGCIGIFLNPISSTGTKTVRNCHVYNCGHGIQIWNDFGGLAYIEHNVINDNLYDGFYPYLGTVYLTNNTIVDNGRDGYNDWSGGGAIYIQNNIIADNGRYGIYKHRDTPVFISYNDVWNNAGGAYYQGYSGPPEPFIPYPGTGEIAADPLFAGAPYGYYISWANFPIPDSTKSPCIDTGNPTSPFDPDWTPSDMGALFFDQHVAELTVTMTPVGPPVQIPPAGGSFDYNVTVTNPLDSTQSADAWMVVTLPDGSLYGPVLGPVTVTIPGGASLTRLRTQNVPGNAPAGTYTYEANLGNYPTNVCSSSGFDFVKLGVGGDGSMSGGWVVSEERLGQAVATGPDGFKLLEAYPNPFNPTTTIRFELPEAARVRLEVYDANGRKVAVGFWESDLQMEAGTHQITFDGSSLPAGVYLARLTAGNWSAMEKLVLLK